MRFALCSDVSCFCTHLAHHFLNNGCSVTILCNKELEICGKWLLAQLTMNFDRRYAYAFKIFITDRTSQLAGAGIRSSFFNRSNDATMRTLEVPLVHSSCDVISLSRTRSCFTQLNGLFTSCGTSGKLTLCKPLILYQWNEFNITYDIPYTMDGQVIILECPWQRFFRYNIIELN